MQKLWTKLKHRTRLQTTLIGILTVILAALKGEIPWIWAIMALVVLIAQYGWSEGRIDAAGAAIARWTPEKLDKKL